MTENPRFSVIIATYNWSSALRVALESVRDQTLSDFEVLVVGDACTDDSEAVVRSFGDERIKWSNLPQNCGSQWGPNNHALGLARGAYVAYLGHDDLWWPTHLATALATFESTGADLVAAAALLYGPPGSGVRAVTGLLPNGIFTPRHFFPPSSMLHRRELAQRAGGWLPPGQKQALADQDFLLRCHAAGARIAATGEFTAFKFNAAWRRDSYRRRDASEQREYLARIRQEGERFRSKELSVALRAAVEDRMPRVETTADGPASATRITDVLRSFKGSRERPPAAVQALANGAVRFPRSNEFAGFEWHPLEQHASLGGYRWTGPAVSSTIVLPVRVDRKLEANLLLIGSVSDETLKTARLEANGVALQTRFAPGPATGTLLWIGALAPEHLPADDREELRLTINVDRTYRPLDRGMGEDRRWVGLAVGWVELAPAA